MLHPAAHPALARVPRYPAAPPRAAVHLASNECASGPSPRALAAIPGALAERYPDPDARAVRAALARAERVRVDEVVVTSGATEAIQLLVRALPGEVLTASGSFPLYARAAAAAGATVRLAPRDRDGRLDLEALAAAVGPDTRLVFVANPDNPTGTTAEGLGAWLRALPGHVVPVVDEAYAGFDPLPDLDGAHPNLVRLRSFSKAHGLASLRIGAALARPPLVDALDRVRDPFNVGGVAQAAALASLHDHRWQARVSQENATWRASLVEGLRARGLAVVEGAANFVFLPHAPGLADALEAQGVTVRPLEAWGMPGAVRVTVPAPDDQQRLFLALDRLDGRSPHLLLRKAS
ncbi:aminotransferase class I/II-fold pyridoxal phosphate-dependent enzyme [Myxococcota bacterium]|nr:aminotransferase class I/II-fold pyridoxal phosphate-dependent enzyme [Myxococcota bacterium]